MRNCKMLKLRKNGNRTNGRILNIERTIEKDFEFEKQADVSY